MEPFALATLSGAQTSSACSIAKKGQYHRAEDTLNKALQIRQKLPDTYRDDFVAQSQFYIAALYRDQGRYRGAEPLARFAVNVWGRTKTTNVPADAQLAAAALILHGDILRGLGQLEAAETSVKRALDIRRQEFGADSLRLAIGLNTLGAIYETQERLAEAETAYRTALKIREQNLPPDHPDLATSRANLGALLKATGKMEEAERLCKVRCKQGKPSLGQAIPIPSRAWICLRISCAGPVGRARPNAYSKRLTRIASRLFGRSAFCLARTEQEFTGKAGLTFGKEDSREFAVGVAEVLGARYGRKGQGCPPKLSRIHTSS